MNYEYTDTQSNRKYRIEEDENVGFYLVVYNLENSSSITDYLCDTLDEAFLEAAERFFIRKDQWQRAT